MRYRVEIARTALADVDGIVGWLADRSPTVANSWLAEFERACATLRDMPLRGAVAPESDSVGHEVRQIFVDRHRVLYVVHDGVVTVVHVRHGQQLPVAPSDW